MAVITNNYYGDYALPKIPIIEGYNYVFIRKNDTRKQYDLLYSKNRWYYNSSSSGVYYDNGYKWYILSYNDLPFNKTWSFYEEEGVNSSDYFGVDSQRTIIWCNEDILNGSSSATDIWKQGQESKECNYYYTCKEVTSDTIINVNFEVEENDYVLATVVCRSEFIYPDGWILLHESINKIGDLNHKMAMLYKKVNKAGDVNFILKQTNANRMYANLIAFKNIHGFKYHDGSEFYDKTTTSLTYEISRPELKSIVWCATKSFWDTNSFHSLWKVSDLVNLIQLPENTQPRLLNAIDEDESISKRIFTSGSTQDAGIIIDYIEILIEEPSLKKYLIKSENNIYTINESNLLKLNETEITSNLFKEKGIDSIPSSDILLQLKNPKLMLWDSDASKIHPLQANMKATPFTQVLYSEDYDMTHSSIKGITNVAVDATDDVLFAVSVDSGLSWKLYDSVNGWIDISEDRQGNTANELKAIISAKWNELATTGKIKFRIVIPNLDSEFFKLIVNYINFN